MPDLNILLLTFDDMNYDSPGCYGNPMEGITPNLDKLAAEGMVFEHSHVTIGVCQPSRSAILTGLFPNHNGARGFEDIDESVTTLTQVLHDNGYYFSNGASTVCFARATGINNIRQDIILKSDKPNFESNFSCDNYFVSNVIQPNTLCTAYILPNEDLTVNPQNGKFEVKPYQRIQANKVSTVFEYNLE